MILADVDVPRIGLGTNRLTTAPEHVAFRRLAKIFGDRRRYERAQRLGRAGAGPFARDGVIRSLPGLRAWTETRDLEPPARRPFREWWAER